MQLISRVLGVVLALAFLSGCAGLGVMGSLAAGMGGVMGAGMGAGMPVSGRAGRSGTPGKLDKQPGGNAGADLIEFPQNQSCRYVGGIRRCD
jgi:hypothetical protein